jgi:hypothetical protein
MGESKNAKEEKWSCWSFPICIGFFIWLAILVVAGMAMVLNSVWSGGSSG